MFVAWLEISVSVNAAVAPVQPCAVVIVYVLPCVSVYVFAEAAMAVFAVVPTVNPTFPANVTAAFGPVSVPEMSRTVVLSVTVNAAVIVRFASTFVA